MNAFLKVLISLFTLSIMISCSSNADIFESYNNDDDSTNISKISPRGDNTEDRDVDWGDIAIADGGGASLGLALASKSGNIYVMLASMLGVGAYASISEYQDQKAECQASGNQISDGKILVNINNPIRPVEFEQKFKLNLQENDLGQQHNQVIRTLINSLDSVLPPMQLFNRVVNVCYTIYPNYNWSRYVTSNIIRDILGEVRLQRRPLVVRNYNSLLYSMPIEELRDTTIFILSSLEPSSAEYQSIAVSYYSRILWNLSIPDPFIATECFVLDRTTNTITFVEGRENVSSYDLNDDQYILMYPSSLEDGKLYIYDLSNNRQSTISTVLTITNNMYSSTKSESKITYPSGKFQIISTGYDGIYYIDTNIN